MTTRKQRLTPAGRRRVFLRKLRETANVSASAAQAGLSRSHVYKLRKRNEAFAEAWDDAVNGALDDIEEALLRRAVEGADKPVFFGGKVCGTTKVYSDRLAMFLLRSRRPEIYGDGAAAPSEPKGSQLDDPNVDPIAVLEARLRVIEARNKNNGDDAENTTR